MKGSSFFISACLAIFLTVLALGCSGPDYNPELPSSSELGSPRGYRIARVITHLHSPISWDACDKGGFTNGVMNGSCLSNLKNALCKNRIDIAFMTDHPSTEHFEMTDLLLRGAQDTIELKSSLPYANHLGDCANGISPIVSVGFEGKIMAFGLTQNLESDPNVRATLYGGDDTILRNRLIADASALVVVPHTESRTVDFIKTLNPQAIEIYNIHANLDPKIRKTDLGLPPFERLASILSYLIDPYKDLNPDYLFLNFFEIAPVYFSKWNQLVTSGFPVTGLGGSDSHENVFTQKASDSERLDSHRRLLRFMSNHYLVSSVTVDQAKTAIQNARGWMVIEGLASPVGMDFYANFGATTVGVGETGSLAGGGAGTAAFTVPLPTFHSSSPRPTSQDPEIRIYLKKAASDGSDTVVAQSVGTSLSYSTSTQGAYRAEIWMAPRHLKKFMGTFDDLTEKLYPWIITNHIYVNP